MAPTPLVLPALDYPPTSAGARSHGKHFAADDARNAFDLDPAERRKLVLDVVAKRLGQAALEPKLYVETNWATQVCTQGGFAAFAIPGATRIFRDAIRAGVGPLHWASTEAATVWPTYIDGAIRSGEPAADEVKKSS